MKRSFPILGTADGEAVDLDLPRLIETRLLVQANSGGGKSWAIRRILEQTHGSVQQIVIDVEDEFHSLREKYDYVLAGREGGDCPADVRSAPLLARRLLELGVSAVVGIYELKAHERVKFVRLFLDSMVNAPRNLWHPVLVVVDEAHLFCPQSSQAESASAVIDLMTRGRKRGFCGVLATQRISKLHKDAAAEANNKLIGRSALDVDMKRAADELGFTSKEDQRGLRTLKPGRFYAFGPAISDEVIEVQVGSVVTTHPRAGQRAARPVPPRAKVKKILSQLADLPQEAADEARTVEELRAEIRRLSRESKTQVHDEGPSPRLVAKLAEAQERGRVEGFEQAMFLVVERAPEINEAVSGALGTAIEKVVKKARLVKQPKPAKGPAPVPRAAPEPHRRAAPTQPSNESGGDLKGPEKRILDSLAWLEAVGVEKPEVTAVAFMAGYRPGGGAFNNPKSRLRGQGLLEYATGGRLFITDRGRALASTMDVPMTNKGLQEAVMARLGGPERKILQPLLDCYPEAISHTELAGLAGYGAGGGAFNNPKSRLRTLGLIDYPEQGMAVARDILFPEGV